MSAGIKIHSVKYNFVMNLMLTVSTYAYSMITFPYVSRVLCASGNGKVSFATSIANYFMLVASLGIPTYGIRACAKVREDRKMLSKVAHEIFIINLLATIISIFVYIILIFNVPRFWAEKELFLINVINIFLNCFGVNWLFQAIEQYDYIAVRTIAFKLVSVLLVFIFVRKPSDYVIYGGITIFATVGSNICNFIRVFRYIDVRVEQKYNFKNHIKPIFVLFALSVATSVYNNLDNIMLGVMKSDVEVGYYNAAVKIKNMLGAVVISLGTVLLPRMTFYVENGDKKKFCDAVRKAFSFIAFISFPMFSYFFVYAPECISVFAGDGYVPAILAMQIILICIVLIGLSNLIGIQILTPLGKEKYVLVSSIVGAITDLIFNLIFIPYLGAAGAAIGTVFAELSVLLVLIYYSKEILIGNVPINNIAKYGILCSVDIVGTCLLIQCFHLNTVLQLVISLFIFGVIYIGELLIVRDEYIIQIVSKVIKGKLKR